MVNLQTAGSTHFTIQAPRLPFPQRITPVGSQPESAGSFANAARADAGDTNLVYSVPASSSHLNTYCPSTKNTPACALGTGISCGFLLLTQAPSQALRPRSPLPSSST